MGGIFLGIELAFWGGMSLSPLQHPNGIPSCPSPGRGTFFQRCFLTAVTPSQKVLNGSVGPPISLGSIFPRIHLPWNRCITTKQDLFHSNLSRLDKASKLAETFIKGFPGIGVGEVISFPGSERCSHPCSVAREG